MGLLSVSLQGKHWFTRQGGQLSNSALAEVDKIFRDRWRTLLSVDDLVAGMVDTLQQEDILEDTVIIYTSDHGFHLGEFTMPIDKETFNNHALAVLLSLCY